MHPTEEKSADKQENKGELTLKQSLHILLSRFVLSHSYRMFF